MKYTLGEAAKASGKSKSTISKSIKNGVISANRLENGRFEIDASELFRVYIKRSETPEVERMRTSSETLEIAVKMARIEERLESSERRNKELEDDRDRWRQQATALLEHKQVKNGLWKTLFG